jgi:acyl-coenzyme A synthetase/AMP-(fatty) acid ligase
VPGELVLGGDCLARGYAGRPDLTAERFVEVDVAGWPQRVYRTGDLAWWSPDGHLNYGGRIDTQVKIRGQRVELGEIESVLNRHPLVANSVVLLRDDLGAAATLVAYAVAERDADPQQVTERALRAFMGRQLPDYMVPLRYVVLPELPATGVRCPPRRPGSAGGSRPSAVLPSCRTRGARDRRLMTSPVALTTHLPRACGRSQGVINLG